MGFNAWSNSEGFLKGISKVNPQVAAMEGRSPETGEKIGSEAPKTSEAKSIEGSETEGSNSKDSRSRRSSKDSVQNKRSGRRTAKPLMSLNSSNNSNTILGK